MNEVEAWGTNRERTLALAARLGIKPAAFQLDFYAGTMFWVRREVLEPLGKLRITLTDFPAERGQRDRQPQHSLERICGALLVLSCEKLEDAPRRVIG